MGQKEDPKETQSAALQQKEHLPKHTETLHKTEAQPHERKRAAP